MPPEQPVYGAFGWQQTTYGTFVAGKSPETDVSKNRKETLSLLRKSRTKSVLIMSNQTSENEKTHPEIQETYNTLPNDTKNHTPLK